MMEICEEEGEREIMPVLSSPHLSTGYSNVEL
jgi:hypothetical protein